MLELCIELKFSDNFFFNLNDAQLITNNNNSLIIENIWPIHLLGIVIVCFFCYLFSSSDECKQLMTKNTRNIHSKIIIVLRTLNRACLYFLYPIRNFRRNRPFLLLIFFSSNKLAVIFHNSLQSSL